MVSNYLKELPAVRRQNLLLEFSALNTACPGGIFMALTPGDPSLWTGVMFIRKGPYAGAILRFQISFPPSYPSLPPIVTFLTEMFHPLIKPLTTYMYTADVELSGSVSSGDEERLLPGGFSLRHGFPDWFGNENRTRLDEENKKQSTRNAEQSVSSILARSNLSAPGYTEKIPPNREIESKEISVYGILRYIRSTFDNAMILDQVPLAAAGNPGAWHAWRTHRTKELKLSLPAKLGDNSVESKSQINFDLVNDQESNPSKFLVQKSAQRLSTSPKATSTSTEWDWDWEGVWKIRVKKCVDASTSESVLFGKDYGDDLIRFLQLEDLQIEELKNNIRKSLEIVETSRRDIL